MLLLATIFGVSSGMALTLTICTEFVGSMALLILERVRELKAEGRAEGLAESHREWTAWNGRRIAAKRSSLPFDEPPPTADRRGRQSSPGFGRFLGTECREP